MSERDFWTTPAGEGGARWFDHPGPTRWVILACIVAFVAFGFWLVLTGRAP